MKAINVFYNVYMGCGFPALTKYYLKNQQLKPDECAVFVNASKTACKVMYPDGLMLYYRPDNGVLNPDAIAALPAMLKSKSISFAKTVWSGMLKEFKIHNAKAA